jgi:GAF domain-containing protein
VDRFVDRILFAQRHAYESALRRFAREAEAYTSSAALLDRALETVSENSEARGVAIYVISNGSGRVARSTDAQFPQSVDLDDPLLVSLRRWGEPVDTRDAKTAFPDGMVFPISARGRLLGALACETKRDFSAFAPDERESLLEVSRGVALALDSLERGDSQSGVLDAIGDLARRIDTLIGALPEKLGAD